jgi:hypothetical protein
MTWTIGTRTALGCGCTAFVEWRAPNTPSLYAVRIDRGLCGARRHTVGRRILGPRSKLSDQVGRGRSV